ncbi:MAG: class I SAM-dependent methyltransferase [Acidimicrobiia bacterium]
MTSLLAALGYKVLRRVAPGGESRWSGCSGAAWLQRSKLDLLDPIGQDISGKTVLNFGCGEGTEVVELARRGARLAIGLDIRPAALAAGRVTADRVGTNDRCLFTASPTEIPPVDVIVSIDAFEHFDDPAGALEAMHACSRLAGPC